MAIVLLGVSSFPGAIPAVFASTVGNATSCSNFAICNYTVGVGGSAKTGGGIGGYLRANMSFSGDLLSFKLPGETVTNNNTGVYSGSANATGVFSSTAGWIYHVKGNFVAPDLNTGNITKGTTQGFVGILSKSGKGGGNTFTLLNGTIKFKPTNLYATVLTVSCNPTSFNYPKTTTCTAIVTDLLGSGSTPTGKVTFSSTLGFSPKSCSLSSGTCSVVLKVAPGTWPVYAFYAGDSIHYKSSARGPELYVGCPTGGC